MAAAKEELSVAQDGQKQNGERLPAVEKLGRKRNGVIDTLLSAGGKSAFISKIRINQRKKYHNADRCRYS